MGVGADTARQAGVGLVGGTRGQHPPARLPGARAQKAVWAGAEEARPPGPSLGLPGRLWGPRLGQRRGRGPGQAGTCTLCLQLPTAGLWPCGDSLLRSAFARQKPPETACRLWVSSPFILMPRNYLVTARGGHGSSTSSHRARRTHVTRSCGGLVIALTTVNLLV